MAAVVSICIATHNKYDSMRKVLASIYRQGVPVEVIVCDDNSEDMTPRLADEFPIVYRRLDRERGYRNPARPRNITLRAATCPILILQSDDVVHVGNTIIPLTRIADKTFNIATVFNIKNGKLDKIMSGESHMAPLFFLGSVWRKHAYGIGGNSEDFILPGGEDNWFSRCLEKKFGLSALYRGDVVGHHLDHERPDNLWSELYAVTIPQFNEKNSAAERGEIPWESISGPWPLDQPDTP